MCEFGQNKSSSIEEIIKFRITCDSARIRLAPTFRRVRK
jgi:hypothetical protein